MRLALLLLIYIFFNSCGYSPIYKSIKEFNYSQIIYNGDKKLNRQISSALSLKEDKNNNSLNKLTIEANKKILVTSKNSKGQIQSYRMVIYLNLIIENSEKKTQQKTFVKDFSYNTKNNKFELSEYENQIENNLIKDIIEEINIYLNT